MSGKNKLRQFAEIKTFPNVKEVEFKEVISKDHSLKGNWAKEVFMNDHPIVLELGCGKGEYTVGMGRQYPEKNFIGVDIKGARMWRGAKTALEESIKNVQFLRTRIEFIESFFGENEISEIWITFPDPQPQLRREKKRLTSPLFINKFLNFLKPTGFIHLKTDNRGLYDYTLEVFQEMKFNILQSSSDLYREMNTMKLSDDERKILSIPTFYEKKFMEKGHLICYLKVANER